MLHPRQAEAQRRIEIAFQEDSKSLDLSTLTLTSVPPELGQLSNLSELYLDQNQLTSVPPELGQLSNLATLVLDRNPNLAFPPPEILAQGTQAVLIYQQSFDSRASH